MQKHAIIITFMKTDKQFNNIPQPVGRAKCHITGFQCLYFIMLTASYIQVDIHVSIGYQLHDFQALHCLECYMIIAGTVLGDYVKFQIFL